jgi:hypothetical protein
MLQASFIRVCSSDLLREHFPNDFQSEVLPSFVAYFRMFQIFVLSVRTKLLKDINRGMSCDYCHYLSSLAIIRALYFARILKLNFDDVLLYLYFTFSYVVFRDAFNKVNS